MGPYVPLHDRPPYLSHPPLDQSVFIRYGSPDLDPTVPLQPSSANIHPTTSSYIHRMAEDDSHAQYYDEVGSGRKRRRDDDGEDGEGGYNNGSSSSYRPRPQQHQIANVPIVPSIFGIAPRNEFTRIIGDFILTNCRGVDNVELEIKLGTLLTPTGPGDARRIRMPTMSETIMPPDYPIGPFVSNMSKQQHASLNRLLNSAAESSMRTSFPIHFTRAKHSDSFHSERGGKVRVSRDRTGEVIENGCIRKKRVADLNVYSPNQVFDWRVSVSREDPAEMPSAPPQSVREKDRACYRHQLCQVDLTVVTTKPAEPGKSPISYELEIEILDVPTLLAEGEKEERGEDNKFDEMIQSCLDTVRMIIRNVG